MCWKNTFRLIPESFKDQFLACYPYHYILMLLIQAFKSQHFISVEMTLLFIGQTDIYMAFSLVSSVILINSKILTTRIMAL